MATLITINVNGTTGTTSSVSRITLVSQAVTGPAGAAGGSPALDDITDVTITSAASGDLLRYSGSAWVDYPDSNYATSGHNHTGTYQPLATVLTNTTAAFTTAQESKLAAIEAAADVTDATNVDAAGAVMNSDSSTAGMSFVIDEDNMATDSATKVPTQQSVKAYADLRLLKVAAGASVEDLGAVESNVNTVASSGATETLDVSVYGVHDITMSESCTFTFSNPAPSGKLSSFVLILRGAYTPTLPASVDWGDATPPTYTTPSMYVFTTVDAGTIWIGVQCAKAIG